MRLMKNVQSSNTTAATSFSLHEFQPSSIPPYAILSHRWTADEVTFADLQDNSATSREGYRKLEFCAKQATDDGIEYFWVDTCCINKESSSELSEAINSMFRWYKDAAKCYVYLSDVSSESQERALSGEWIWRSQFQKSEWFTRGWTLQELIAPTVVEFFSIQGRKLGDKRSLEREICHITKIPAGALRGEPLSLFGIEQRMSWATKRCTTIEEDSAYCLLGIFEVHMPLIYGEGHDEALVRLRRKFRSVHVEDRMCHQAFKTSSYISYKDRNPLRVPDTCLWVLSHPHFCDWLSGQQPPLLWISADPGCGKSVLCRSLIDQELFGGWQGSVCYFFFKDNGEQDSLTTALCAILHQLFNQQPHLLHHARPAWDDNGDKILREIPNLWNIFLQAVADRKCEPVICVFDALDECQDDDRRQLIDRLCGLLLTSDDTCSHRLKVLATSRPYDEVQRWFSRPMKRWPCIRLHGEDQNEQIRREINLVIEQNVSELASQFDLPSTDHQYLLQQLLQMQHRTYLWLYLAMEAVREACRDSIFAGHLQIQSLPSSVEDAYERILHSIGQQQQQSVRKILLIIIGARRPLTIAEMSMALSTAITDGRGLVQSRTTDVRRLEKHIRQHCGLFVYIQHSQLFLIHQTAKEFLLKDNYHTTIASCGWKSSFCATEVEQEMARICVTFLDHYFHSHTGHSRKLDSPQEVHTHDLDSAQEPEFFRYCAEHWTSHLDDNILQRDSKLLQKVMELYQEHRSFGLWFPYAWRILRGCYSVVPNLHILHAVAVFGHKTVLLEIVRRRSLNVGQQDTTGMTALHWAAASGNIEVVQLLLEHGADVNAQSKFSGTALLMACDKGYVRIVELLLVYGADVRARIETDVWRSHSTALEVACFNGYVQIVQLLFAEGNTHAEDYSTALYIASELNHIEIVELVLGFDVDVNAYAGYFDTALQVASVRGHTNIVQLLLDHGADVNAQGGCCNTALVGASRGGNTEIVQQLLDHGADINAGAGDYGTALQAASGVGCTETVKVLLERGADVNAQGGVYGNALYTSSADGNVQIVRLLLNTWVDVDSRGRGNETPLQMAAVENHLEIVRLLLNRGANVNAQGGLHGTALHAASAEGHIRVVELLLDYGVDINAREDFFGTALQVASAKNHLEIVHLLVSRGADADFKG